VKPSSESTGTVLCGREHVSVCECVWATEWVRELVSATVCQKHFLTNLVTSAELNFKVKQTLCRTKWFIIIIIINCNSIVTRWQQSLHQYTQKIRIIMHKRNNGIYSTNSTNIVNTSYFNP
jgi:hypothetical protein